MTFLENKIPPPLVALLCGGVMWYLAGRSPSIGIPDSSRIPATVVVVIMGVLVMLAGIVSFRRARTTISPLKPETATALVVSGIYSHTRNPMYLGMLVVLLGWAVFLSSLLALTGVVIFWLFIERFQIRPEESALRALFGDAFADYTARVRRWL